MTNIKTSKRVHKSIKRDTMNPTDAISDYRGPSVIKPSSCDETFDLHEAIKKEYQCLWNQNEVKWCLFASKCDTMKESRKSCAIGILLKRQFPVMLKPLQSVILKDTQKPKAKKT